MFHNSYVLTSNSIIRLPGSLTTTNPQPPTTSMMIRGFVSPNEVLHHLQMHNLHQSHSCLQYHHIGNNNICGLHITNFHHLLDSHLKLTCCHLNSPNLHLHILVICMLQYWPDHHLHTHLQVLWSLIISLADFCSHYKISDPDQAKLAELEYEPGDKNCQIIKREWLEKCELLCDRAEAFSSCTPTVSQGLEDRGMGCCVMLKTCPLCFVLSLPLLCYLVIL